ncbi:MAG TPA: lanthionine synthetase LanC family protein [Nakamurella sp.]
MVTALTPLSVDRMVGRICDELLATAVVAEGEATWLSPWPGENAPVRLRTGDPTIYSGSAGIALACLEVGLATGHDEMVELALAAARHAVRRGGDLPSPGLHDGRAGVGLSALAVGTAAADSNLAAAGGAMLDDACAAAQIADDVIGGGAGVLVGCVRAAEIAGPARWLDRAAPIAAGLVERAVRRPWGWSWPASGCGPVGLCGLAHGSAGVAWALAEYLLALGSAPGGITGPAGGAADGVMEAVARACQYERSWFDPRSSGWPDLRDRMDRSDKPPLPSAWCHGAVGIGVSRLVIGRVDPPADMTAAGELAAALLGAVDAAETRLRGMDLPSGLTQCHGLGGTVDLLLDASVEQQEPAHRASAAWIAERALDVLGADVASWPGGFRGVPAPGLMDGLSGTLVTLTRLAGDPARCTVGRLRLGVSGRRDSAGGVVPAS